MRLRRALKEKYIRFEEVDALRAEIEERHRLEKKIRELKMMMP